jgi:hypothetical protein
LERDVPTVVLTLGDRDKHGGWIYTAAAEDAVAWAEGEGEIYPIGRRLEQLRVERIHARRPGLIFYRLALTTEQAQALDLLDADGKAEVDGVPVPVMDRWLIEAIEALHVSACRERLRDEEERERKRLPAAMRQALDDAQEVDS